MKKTLNKDCFLIVIMLILTGYGYSLFYNRAFSGYEARGAHIWLSASTVKFVNNWLKEGPINLNFIMYENIASIEFNSLTERDAYISYPPGSVIPVYVLARILNKDEIQVGFIKAFLRIKFLFDTLLVCLILYSFFRVILRLKHRYFNIILSIFLSLSWMCFPINLYYLRNVYFADQAIITVVLLFILLEILNDYFVKKPLLKYIFLAVKIFVLLYGVLTDWYFLFVMFVCWIVKLVSMVKSKENSKKIVFSSLAYVLPVVLGISLFITQIMTIPNYANILLNKAQFRIFTNYFGDMPLLLHLLFSFIRNYTILPLIVLSYLFLIIIKCCKNKITDKYFKLFGILAIIYIPPVFHLLIFQNHSAIHEFSLLKFSLPVILLIPIATFFILDAKDMLFAYIKMKIENKERAYNFKIRLFYIIIMFSCIINTIAFIGDEYYFVSRIGEQVNYERENLIRENYDFNDVYFSFTEAININPPEYLAVSRKRIYRIESLDDINRRFPNLDSNARILLMVNVNDHNKPDDILLKEKHVRAEAQQLFSSTYYAVYDITNIVPLD